MWSPFAVLRVQRPPWPSFFWGDRLLFRPGQKGPGHPVVPRGLEWGQRGLGTQPPGDSSRRLRLLGHEVLRGPEARPGGKAEHRHSRSGH